MRAAPTVANAATTRVAIAARRETRRAPRATPRASATPRANREVSRARGVALATSPTLARRATRATRDGKKRGEIIATNASARCVDRARARRASAMAPATAFVASDDLRKMRARGAARRDGGFARAGEVTEVSRAKRRARRTRTREHAREGRGGGGRESGVGIALDRANGAYSLGFPGGGRAARPGTIGCFDAMEGDDGGWTRDEDRD